MADRDCITITATIVSIAFMIVTTTTMMMMMMMNLIDKTEGEKTCSSDSNARQTIKQQVPAIVVLVIVI